jgi:DNA-binding NarL/FixJ family response regulator
MPVAKPYVERPVDPVRVDDAVRHSFAPHPYDGTRHEAFGADPLADLWESVISGRMRRLHPRDSVRFAARFGVQPARPLCPEEASLVRTVLCGEARKALACDLGIALSTVTGRYLRALTKMDLTDCAMPLVLVLAAQSRAGLIRIPSARTTYVDDEGYTCVSVSVPRPDTTWLAKLTPTQQQIAHWLISGCTRETIAERRCKSVHTVAGQVHAVFHALRVTGRYALIRRACELGCFNQAACIA